jgi:hypothetical protein
MTHLELENLASDYLEGLLEPPVRAGVVEHLAGCPGCPELLEDVRHALDLCRKSEFKEPAPWLVSKILLATVGQRKPTWRERLSEYLRPILQPRVAYPVAMTVFTFSIIVNAAGLNLRTLRFEDLNPRTWVDRADRQKHLLAARVEKFCYDLRVVVEIESRIRELGGQPQVREEEPSKPAAPDGGSSQGESSDQTIASVGANWVVAAVGEQPHATIETHPGFTGKARSLIP